MSFATWNFMKVYARIREAFLRLNPESRLIPDRPEGDPAGPIISLGEKGQKMVGLGILVVILLLASNRD